MKYFNVNFFILLFITLLWHCSCFKTEWLAVSLYFSYVFTRLLFIFSTSSSYLQPWVKDFHYLTIRINVIKSLIYLFAGRTTEVRPGRSWCTTSLVALRITTLVVGSPILGTWLTLARYFKHSILYYNFKLVGLIWNLFFIVKMLYVASIN